MQRAGEGRPSIGAAIFAGVLALCLLMAVPAQGGSTAAGPRPGRELLAEFTLPATVLAQYARHQPLVHLRKDAPKRHLTLAEAVPWHGPGLLAGGEHNPYNLVLSITGRAPAAGEVRSLWQLGWEYDETNGQRRRYVVPQADSARAGVAAGSVIELTAATGPVRFRELRQVLPYVGLVQLDNLDVTQVRLQIWSGPAPTAWQPDATWLLKALLLIALAGTAAVAWPALRRARRAPAPLPFRCSRPAETPTQAAPATVGHAQRVAAALSEVLTRGLVVESVPDATRPRRRRARRP